MDYDLISIRKHLHQNPELSSSESKTASYIHSLVAKFHPSQIISNVGGNGLIAVWSFGESGSSIAFRCELDALPIEEANDFPHKSTINGISHKCGHDGHMTILVGLAQWLSLQNFKSGKVILIFQPAEETGRGAYEMLRDPQLKELSIDYLFALHNIPGAPMHEVQIMRGGFSAEVLSFAIHLKGKETHAATPELGINPSSTIAGLLDALNHLNIKDPKDPHFTVLTPVHINMGEKAYGISPGQGELHFTVRTWGSERMAEIKKEIEKITSSLCDLTGLHFNINWFEHFPASINDEGCNAILEKACLSSGINFQKRPYPFKFGEDFGWFSQQYNSTMFGLGAGVDTPPLHDVYYDFPDGLIGSGVEIYSSIITTIFSGLNF